MSQKGKKKVEHIDHKVEHIDHKIGDCNVCSTLEIIDTKLNTLDPSNNDGYSLLEIIDSKIDLLNPANPFDCSICDELSIIDSKIDELLTDDSCATIPIYNAMTITTSGSYCLANSINGTITVAASQVTLDLNGYTIYPEISSIGIDVLAQHKNFQIKNGFIVGGGGGYNSAAIVVNDACSDFVISDVEIWGGLGDGIEMLPSITGITNFAIKNCIVANVGLRGINCGDCSDFVLDNCTTQSCAQLSSNWSNFTVAGSQNYILRNCIAQDSNGECFHLIYSSSGYLDNCTAENSRGPAFDFSQAFNIIATNCVAQTGLSNGFYLSNNASQCKITNCTAMNITGTGFNSSTGTNNLIQGCTALNNSDSGFYNNDSNNYFASNYALNNGLGNFVGVTNAPITNLGDTCPGAFGFWKNYDGNSVTDDCCVVCDDLSVIDSKLDDLSVIDSKLEALETQSNTIQSLLDYIIANCLSCGG